MKKNNLIRLSVFLLTIAFFLSGCNTNKIDYPSPFDEEKDELRKVWIETIHRTAPGVDWRAMDDSTRWAKYQSKLPELQASRPGGRLKNETGGFEAIADGFLTGNWIEKGSNNLAGRMHCVDIDFSQNRLYGAAAGGQIWVGNIDGSNWVSLTDHFQVKDVQFLRVFKNAQAGTRILMNPRDRVAFYYSDDMGVTWLTAKGLSGYTADGKILRGISKPDGTIYLLINRFSTKNHLFRSTDLGESFELITQIDGTQYSDIWSNRFTDGSLWYIDRENVFKLVDNDLFEKKGTVNINFSANKINHVQLAGSHVNDTTFLYAMMALDKSSRFFGSIDGGVNWSVRGTNSEGPFMSNSFGVSNIDPNIVAFGGVNAYISRDGARTWMAVNTWGEYYGDIRHKLHADIPEIEFFLKPNGSELVWVSTDGGTYYSDDALQSVFNVSTSNLNISQYYSTYTHRDMNNVIYAGAQDQGFQRALEEGEGGVSFQQTISGDYGHIVSADRGSSLWTVYPGFAMRYPDAVNSTYMVSWDFSGRNHFWMPPLMEDPYDPARVFLAGGTSSSGNHLWQLSHVNSSISVVELPFDFSGGNENFWISAMSYSPINKDYRFVLNSGGRFYFSSDAGNNWERSASYGPGSHYFYGNTIVCSPVDINTIYIAGSGYSSKPVYVSKDGGSTFRSMSTGMPSTLVFEMKSNEDGTLLFAATETGPYVYIEAKKSWYDLAGINAPEQTYWSVDYISSIKTARFGTYGRGIWDFKIASYLGKPDYIKEDDFAQIYPNPARDLINVVTGETLGDLSVTILRLDGRVVFTNILKKGSGNTSIDVGNLTRGIYLVRMQDDNRTTSVKLIVN